MADPDPPLMAPADVRRVLGISARTYRRYLHDGILVADVHTLGGHRRFRPSTVEAARDSAVPKPTGVTAQP